MVIVQSAPYLSLSTRSGDRYLPLQGIQCWTVGRSDNNNLVLSDRWISRHHAMFQAIDQGDFYLIDLGSRNGTFLNGRRVTVPVILKDGDLITFGQTELRFFCPQPHLTNDQGISPPGHSAGLAPTAALHVRQLMTVMVVDIRDFTVMARQVSEKILAEAIGTWFRRAGEIIGRYGSGVDKYIGDAVMAVWVHQSADTTVVEIQQILRAVNALAEMTAALHQQFPLPFGLKIGAGLNSGYAMVGNTGSGDRPDYTPIGDTVNVAFRLESATKALGVDIAMGESTYNLLIRDNPSSPGEGQCPLSWQPHTLRLKGYENPIAAYTCHFAQLHHWLTQPQVY
ncbi:MAG: adenylate/guanylate cyclase domain-containing protein [Cyanobacteriota bacterium]|nr:adenylate/guanylate cyclase domain-containing protein [Cyanobacteriota bacterium]